MPKAKAADVEVVGVEAVGAELEEPDMDLGDEFGDEGEAVNLADGDENEEEDMSEGLPEMERIPEGAEGSPEVNDGSPGWEPKDVKAARLAKERAAAAAKKSAEEAAKTEAIASELAVLEQQELESVNNATAALTHAFFDRAAKMDIPTLKTAYGSANQIEGAAWLSRCAVTYWLKLRVHQAVALTRRREKDGAKPDGPTDFEQAIQEVCREVGTSRPTLFNDDAVYRAFFEQEVVTHDGVSYNREQSLNAVRVLVHQNFFKIARRHKACPRKALAIMVDAALSDPGFGQRSAQLIVDNLNAGKDPRAVREVKEAEAGDGDSTASAAEPKAAGKQAAPEKVNTGLLPVDIASLISCLSKAGEAANRSEAVAATWYIIRGANGAWAVQSVPPSVQGDDDDVMFISVHREDTGRRIYANVGFDVADKIKDSPEKSREYLVG